MRSQQIISAHILSAIRGMEQALCLDSIAQRYRSPFALRGMPRRKHKITDRPARKAAARRLHVRLVQNGETILNHKV